MSKNDIIICFEECYNFDCATVIIALNLNKSPILKAGYMYYNFLVGG